MYHYNLKISVFFLEPQKCAWLREVPSLEGFTNNYIIDPPINGESIALSDIIVWAKPACQKDLLFLRKYKRPDAVLVLLSNREELLKAESWVDVADNMWPRILKKNILQSLFKRLLQNFKTFCDNKLTESYLNALIDNMPDMVWFKNLNGAHEKVNDKFCEVVGKKREDIINKNHCEVWDIDPKEYKAGNYVCMETEAPVLEQGKSFMFEEKVKFRDGLHFLNTYKSPVFDKNKKVIGSVGYARDITALWDESTEMRLILNYLPMPLMLTDTDDIIKIVNNSFCLFFETRPEATEGKDANNWEKNYKNLNITLLQQEEEDDTQKSVFTYKNSSGTTMTIGTARKTLHNVDGKVIGYVYNFENLQAEREAAATNYKNSITDELTGIYNRRHYRNLVAEYVKTGKKFTVAEIDCDRLKNVNDQFGHATGDEYIINIVKMLQSKMHPDETLCRIGGDEFVLLSMEKDQKEILQMLDSVNQQLKDSNLRYPAGISFGAETMENINFEEYRKCIHYVDQQLYNMKRIKNINTR